jgi:hypothetical protein
MTDGFTAGVPTSCMWKFNLFDIYPIAVFKRMLGRAPKNVHDRLAPESPLSVMERHTMQPKQAPLNKLHTDLQRLQHVVCKNLTVLYSSYYCGLQQNAPGPPNDLNDSLAHGSTLSVMESHAMQPGVVWKKLLWANLQGVKLVSSRNTCTSILVADFLQSFLYLPYFLFHFFKLNELDRNPKYAPIMKDIQLERFFICLWSLTCLKNIWDVYQTSYHARVYTS